MTIPSRKARLALAVAATLCAVAWMLAANTRTADARALALPAHAHKAPTEQAAETSAALADAQRRSLAWSDDEMASESAEERLTFEQFVDALVEHGIATAQAADAGDDDLAIEHDRAARLLFAALMRQTPDADEKALQAIAACPAQSRRDGESLRLDDTLRHNVLLLAISIGMQQRLRAANFDRAATDALTTGALTALLARPDLAASLGVNLLADKPYLGPPHESLVLEIVAESGKGRIASDAAVSLLSTLWANLQRDGARTSSQLAGLALLLLDSDNLAERLSAARRLVLDDRYRDAALLHMRQTQDQDLARAMAMAAAEELDATAAFSVITQAAEVTGQDTAPFLTLAHRDPAMLRKEYEQRLGSDVTPRVRALLVAGAGFSGTAEGIEVARLALSSDPDPEVRMRALFVLTGKTAATLGEAAIAEALDDPAIGGNSERLGAVTLAIENLARAGLVNAVHRLGQRMRAMPGLSPSTRTMLDRLLAESLPGGNSGAGNGR